MLDFSIVMRLACLCISAALVALLCLPHGLGAATDAPAHVPLRLTCETRTLVGNSTCNEICAKRDETCVAAASATINPAKPEALSCETRGEDHDPFGTVICRCCAVR